MKQNGLSFYYALIHLCTEAVNSVENFRYTVRGGEAHLLEGRDPSFTDLHSGSELFHIVTMRRGDSVETFCRDAAARSRAQERFICSEAESDALIYFSCLPWLELTALKNEGVLNADDAIPRICWGKYVERDGRKLLNLSVEVNHRFVDGIHVGRFCQTLERLMEELKTD